MFNKDHSTNWIWPAKCETHCVFGEISVVMLLTTGYTSATVIVEGAVCVLFDNTLEIRKIIILLVNIIAIITVSIFWKM